MSLFLRHPAVHAIGGALLHFIWQGVLVAALVFVANALIRPSQARLRYAIACMAMVLMPVLFGTTIFRIASSPVISPVVAATPLTPASLANNSGRDRTPTGTTIQDIQASHTWNLDLLAGWAVFLWLTGVAALAIYTLTGWGRVRRLTRQGVEPAAPALVETLESLRERLRISQPVQLCISAIAEVPAVIGWLRPYILLPISAISGLSESEIRAILAHELAHIRRHDYLVNLFQNAVETLLFYHPAVWWVSGHIRKEREHCCDDIAVAICGDAMAYAGALTQLEELRGIIGDPALAATGGDLLGRIRRLTGAHRAPRHSISGLIASVLALAMAAGVFPIMHAQQPRLEFEVATVKPSNPANRDATVQVHPGGRLVMPRMTVRALVPAAFHLGYWQVSGGDAWTEKEEFAIEANPPAELRSVISRRHTWWGIEDERLQEMLQSLLISRFHLQFHRETKTGKVYLLERKGNKSVLKPTDSEFMGSNHEADPGFSGDIGFAGRWVLYNVSMPQLAKHASDYVMHAPVIDRTGLIGAFDYKQPGGNDPELEALSFEGRFLALLDQLGLKLTPSQGPVETLVIDHAEKPTEN